MHCLVRWKSLYIYIYLYIYLFIYLLTCVRKHSNESLRS
jgi:hypothetical protein